MKDIKKKIIKFTIVFILIFGFYYGSQVVPVEEKRVQASLDNFETSTFNFDFNGSLEKAREGFYDFSASGYTQEGGAEGNFSLSTRLEGEVQEIEGEFVYKEGLYLNFSEDGLPIVLEGFLTENYDYQIEEVRNKWVRLPIELERPTLTLKEESVQVLDEEESINDKEMYYYSFDLMVDELFEGELSPEIFTGKEDLQIYRLMIDQDIELSRGFELDDPFIGFSAGSSPTLELTASFSDFNHEKELESPEEYIDF